MKDLKKLIGYLLAFWGIWFGLFTLPHLNLVGNFHYTDSARSNFLIDLAGIIGLILFVWKLYGIKVEREYEDREELERKIKEEYEKEFIEAQVNKIIKDKKKNERKNQENQRINEIK